MSKVNVACPNCEKSYAIVEANLGRKGKCKHCNTTFVLTRTDDSTPGDVPASDRPSEPTVSGRQFPAAESVPAKWKAGDLILDLYEVKGVLGQGGMGTVYQVHHRTWNMNLAVKCPLPSYFRTNQQKENFTRECQTWIDLGLHPNIVSCYYVRTLGGIPRVFAECVEGGSLKEWIDSGKLYEGGHDAALKRILDISIQFAWGLDYAHEKQLIHQDVKPANVLLTSDGTVKVSDFGLANARVAAGETILALGGREQSILASYGGKTPAYCSPEQDNQEKLTRRTDLWSWSVSVLEMFTGEVTWHGGSVAGAALEGYLANGSNDNRIPQMTTSIAELLRHCFQIEPEARPRTMAEVADRLVAIYEQVVESKYNRPRPQAVELTADSLNNQAVSLLDLGQAEQAVKLWDQALERHPGHLQATYNRGLLLWRSGRITDEAVLTQLQDAWNSQGSEWEGAYLMGQIQLERWDAERAIDDFDAALKLGGDMDVRSAMASAQRLIPHAPKHQKTLAGHKEFVASAAITKDGLYAISASGSELGYADHTLRLWDTTLAQAVHTFGDFEPHVSSVSLSTTSRHVLSGSKDGLVRLWDIATGKCLMTYSGHSESVESVALSPDGSLALSGSKDTTLRLWDVTTGQCLQTFVGHEHWVTSVAFTSNGDGALSASADTTLRLWDINSGLCRRTFSTASDSVSEVEKALNYSVKALAISSDGVHALSGSQDGAIRLWDISSGHCKQVFRGHTKCVYAVGFGGSGRYALSCSYDGTIRLWKVLSGQCLRTFHGLGGGIHAVALSTDGQHMVTGEGTTLRTWRVDLPVWELADCRANYAVSVVHGTTQRSQFALAHDSALEHARQSLLLGRYEDTLKQIKMARQIPGYERSPLALELKSSMATHLVRKEFCDAWQLRTFQHRRELTSVSFSDDNRRIHAGDQATMGVWDISTGKWLHAVRLDTPESIGYYYAMAFTSDSKYAFVADYDEVRAFDLASGRVMQTYRGHTSSFGLSGSVNAMALSKDNRYLLTGSCDCTVRLWDVASGNCLRTFTGHNDHVKFVSLSADRRFAISGGDDRTVRLWDTNSGDCLHRIEMHASSAAFRSDGRYALLGGADMRLWDISSGKWLRTVKGATSPVALSDDGQYALSGSHDNTVCLWNLRTSQCLRVFSGHIECVTTVAFGANCSLALSGSADKTVRLWALDWDFGVPQPGAAE